MSVKRNNKSIILEGLPGTGKSTLGGLFREEGVFIIPEIILKKSNTKEEGEFFYFRNDLEKIKKSKELGEISIIERSHVSTLAHNYARLIIEGNKEYFNILKMYAENKISNNINPDLYIYIDIDTETSLIRKNRPVRDDDIWTQKKYLEIISDYYKMHFKFIEPDIPHIAIDGNRGLNPIYNDIKKYVFDNPKHS